MLLSMFNLLCKLVVGWTFYKTVMSGKTYQGCHKIYNTQRD